MKFFKYLISILSVFLLCSFVVSCASTISGPSGSTDISSNTTEDSSMRVDFSEMTFVAFGDSITFGADRLLGYAAMDFPYPALVAESLGFAAYSNLGVNGATFCSNKLDRLCMTDSILAYTQKADIISIMLGVNDFIASLPLGDEGDKTTATIYGSLNLIAEHLTTVHKDSFVFFMTPYKCIDGSLSYEDKNKSGYTLEDVVIAIQTVALKYNIPVLDMFHDGQFELEMYHDASDGLHPSQEFIREYTAPQIVEFIRQNYTGK